jgi:hypothetical protein
MENSDNKDEEFALQGTVIELRPMRGKHPHQKWLVVLRIESVVSGAFSGDTFSFNIHSPVKSRISTGGRYLLHATKTTTGDYLIRKIEPGKNRLEQDRK